MCLVFFYFTKDKLKKFQIVVVFNREENFVRPTAQLNIF